MCCFYSVVIYFCWNLQIWKSLYKSFRCAPRVWHFTWEEHQLVRRIVCLQWLIIWHFCFHRNFCESLTNSFWNSTVFSKPLLNAQIMHHPNFRLIWVLPLMTNSPKVNSIQKFTTALKMIWKNTLSCPVFKYHMRWVFFFVFFSF